MDKIGNCFLLIFFFAFSLAGTAHADASIKVSVSPNPVHEDENIQFSIQIDSENTADIENPSFDAPDFTQVGRSSSTSVSSQYVGGKISMVEKVVYTYILIPTRKGSLKISAIEVGVGGKHLRAPDQSINVLAANGNAPSRTQEDDQREEDQNPAYPSRFQSGINEKNSAPERLNSDFTVHVNLNKKTAYVGEPIIAEYWIYDFGGLQNIDVQKWPTFNGFWKEDLQIATRYQFQDTYVKNQPARKAMLGKFALYAIKPGKLPIDNLIINGKYIDRNPYKNRGDDVFNFFLGSVGQIRSGSHASQEVSVEILPLPEQGRPSNFTGAVGKFKMDVFSDKQSAQANTPINISIAIEGAGNFQAIDKFQLPLPQDFELYESNASVNGSAPIGGSRSLENKKTFHYLVLPRKSGKFTIPSISWSYFDPEKKGYQTLTSNPIHLDISPDDGTHQSNTYSNSQNSEPAAGSNTPEPTAPATKLELNYLKPIAEINSAIESKLSSILILLLAAVNLILLGIALRRYIKKPSFLSSPKRKLSELLGELDKNKPTSKIEYYVGIETIVHKILDILLSRNSIGMTLEEVEQEWKAHKFPVELLQRIQAILQLSERERFSRNKEAPIDLQEQKKNTEELRMILARSMELI